MGCAVVLLTISAATAQPKAIVVLSSLHHLDYAEAGCSHLRVVADMKGITEVLNNASDFDPKDVKFNKQGYDKFNGNFNAVTMLAEEQNNYWELMSTTRREESIAGRCSRPRPVGDQVVG